MKAGFSSFPEQLKMQNSTAKIALKALLIAVALICVSPAFCREVTLKDGSWVVAFDSESGVLTRLECKSPQWTVEGRPALGASFWMDI
ncbi:MAG TPA: hypothetical protein VGY98_20385, partial [Verrucomicrobiae bacterium]|nr:hypothetical protein [Verrucomicrobiae bacterium]